VRLGAAAGLVLALAMLWPFAGPAVRAVRMRLALRPALAAAAAGDRVTAWLRTEKAALRDPASPRPWFLLARTFAWHDKPQRALAAIQRGAPLASAANWSAPIGRPRFWREMDMDHDARRAGRNLDKLSWDTDPWLVLEVAWRDLPPPRADEVILGGGHDYGAVRGFLHPRGAEPPIHLHRLEWNRYDLIGGPQAPSGTHRWSRHRAWLRLRPTTSAPAYDVTLVMGSPFPSPLETARVTVSAAGVTRRFDLDRDLRPFVVPGVRAVDGVVAVTLSAPAWSRAGEPADQGVRVDRMTATPATSP
jgi:hypothetical protein